MVLQNVSDETKKEKERRVNRTGSILSKIRSKRKLSHSKLAQLTGVDPSAYSRWEDGSRSPSPIHLQAIINGLKLRDRYRKMLVVAYYADKVMKDGFDELIVIKPKRMATEVKSLLVQALVDDAMERVANVLIEHSVPIDELAVKKIRRAFEKSVKEMTL